MFEGLELEIASIKTPRFHVVDRCIDATQCQRPIESGDALPISYRSFSVQFGNAKLYRRSRNNSYQVGVFASPRIISRSAGTQVYQLGFHDGAIVYAKNDLVDKEQCIYEYESGLDMKVADDFAQWLADSCADARSNYDPQKWEEILRGPDAFSPEELRMIAARRFFSWEVLGIASNGDHILKVVNAGNGVLPVLTVGVRSKNGRLNGAISLKTGHIAPGNVEILHAAVYKGLLPVAEVELYDLPDPQPEDREFYSL